MLVLVFREPTREVWDKPHAISELSTICVLEPHQADELHRNVQPDCSKHRHIKKQAAMVLTGRGNFDDLRYNGIDAEWVGPRHIVLRIKQWIPTGSPATYGGPCDKNLQLV